MISKEIPFILLLIIIFILGLYVTVFHVPCGCAKENMDNQSNSSCPDMLVKRGNVLMLYNSKKPTDSTNPIPFFNLDEYINYLEVQRQNGNDCPVLFLQEETNAQGENIYRMRPSPFDLQGGLPSTPNVTEEDIKKMQNAMEVLDASRDNLPFNKNQYAGFDPQGQHVGEYTKLDAIHDSTASKRISDNPMDGNWAGTTYTQQMVDSGKYEGNEITKPTLFNPKVAFFPELQGPLDGPKDFL